MSDMQARFGDAPSKGIHHASIVAKCHLQDAGHLQSYKHKGVQLQRRLQAASPPHLDRNAPFDQLHDLLHGTREALAGELCDEHRQERPGVGCEQVVAD